MLLAGADLVRRHRSALTLVLFVAALVPFFIGLIYWAPHTGHLELQDSLLDEFWSSSYVIGGVLLALGCCLTGRVATRGSVVG
jgi:hypothetical protein